MDFLFVCSSQLHILRRLRSRWKGIHFLSFFGALQSCVMGYPEQARHCLRPLIKDQKKKKKTEKVAYYLFENWLPSRFYNPLPHISRFYNFFLLFLLFTACILKEEQCQWPYVRALSIFIFYAPTGNRKNLFGNGRGKEGREELAAIKRGGVDKTALVAPYTYTCIYRTYILLYLPLRLEFHLSFGGKVTGKKIYRAFFSPCFVSLSLSGPDLSPGQFPFSLAKMFGPVFALLLLSSWVKSAANALDLGKWRKMNEKEGEG